MRAPTVILCAPPRHSPNCNLPLRTRRYEEKDELGEVVSTELALPLSYGEARHFRFELRDAGARLRFLSVLTAAATDGADASTTRTALLVSRGRCPSVDAYDVGSWAEDATAAQAALANVVRSADLAAEAEDGTTRAALASGGVQLLTVPYEVASEGSYYLALVGISPDPVELQLFGAVQCGLGERAVCVAAQLSLRCGHAAVAWLGLPPCRPAAMLPCPALHSPPRRSCA